MALLIDSSVLIALERRGLPVDAVVSVTPDEQPAIASITASELLVGVYRATPPERRRQREAYVHELLENLTVVPFDLPAARAHAEIFTLLSEAGQMIGRHDLIIAATALAQGSTVLTDNLREFGRVPGLIVHRPV